MPLTIVLDTSPLSSATRRAGVPEADACRRWIVECRSAGHQVLAPAIAYYEVARELVRAGNTAAIHRLDAFCSQPGCYLPFTDTSLHLAVTLWAQSRNRGTPTADPKELDCDVLIAAQALDLGLHTSQVVVATMNVGHLAQFVSAKLWIDITP
jgi:predicted nucleic acid-binding protein